MNISVGLISPHICAFTCSSKTYISVAFNAAADILTIWHRFEGQSFNKNHRSGYLYLSTNAGLWVLSSDAMKLPQLVMMQNEWKL